MTNPIFKFAATGAGEVRDKDGNLLDFQSSEELDKHIVDTYEQENEK